MYKQKLKELLCTLPEIKEQIMELKLGTRILLDCSDLEWCKPEKVECEFLFMKTMGLVRTYVLFKDYTFPLIEQNVRGVVDFTDWWEFNIIWNPLEERFLRMYLEEKWINFIIATNGNSTIYNQDWLIKDVKQTWITFDNTKPFSNQTEKVYQEIYEFLINNK